MRHDRDDSLFESEDDHLRDPAQQAFDFCKLDIALSPAPTHPSRRERRFPLRSMTGTVRAPGLPIYRLQVQYCPVSRFVLSHRLIRAD